jgi:hypothetical protein
VFKSLKLEVIAQYKERLKKLCYLELCVLWNQVDWIDFVEVSEFIEVIMVKRVVKPSNLFGFLELSFFKN